MRIVNVADLKGVDAFNGELYEMVTFYIPTGGGRCERRDIVSSNTSICENSKDKTSLLRLFYQPSVGLIYRLRMPYMRQLKIWKVIF